MNAPEDDVVILSKLDVALDLHELPKAAAWLAAIAEREGWRDRVRFGLDLSLDEALTNVISYGFEGVSHEPRVRVEFFHLPMKRVAVRIIDNGIAFDPLSVTEPEIPVSIDDARIGGHGVQLMRHFLGEITYERVGDENRLTLVAFPGEGG